MRKKNNNTKKNNQTKEMLNDIIKFSFFVVAFSYFLVFSLYLFQFFGIDNSFILQKIKDFLLIYLFIVLGISMTSHYLDEKI